MSSPAKPPFHVLFLPGGNTSLESKTGPDEKLTPLIAREDYLTHRFEFWKRKAASNQQVARDVTEYPVDSSRLNGGGENKAVLRQMSTPLELALVDCCERLAPDRCQFLQLKPLHRSRLHRPICPSNYDAGPEEGDAEQQNQPSGAIEGSKSKSSILRETGILLRGKECHFLSLLCMHCTARAVGHRALALAILQRTVDWEVSNDRPSDMAPLRTKHFLEAGGMKLLARWLIASFTVDSGSKSHVSSPTGCLLLPILQLLKTIPFNKNVVVSSHIHKIIKRLKKAIDTLVDGLDQSQLKQKHPITGGLPVGKVLSVLDELMSVWKQAAAADLQMSNCDIHTIESQHNTFDDLEKELKSRFESLATLQNEGGQPPQWLPTSISSIISGKSNLLAMHANSFKPVVAKHAGNATSSEISGQKTVTPSQNWYDPTSNEPKTEYTRTWEKFMSKKRKGQFFADEKNSAKSHKLNHNEASKKVSWADRPLSRKNTTQTQQLVEVRMFYKEAFDEQEATPHLHSDDLNSTKHQDGDQSNPVSEDMMVKEESIDDSELEDLCEDPDLADMF